MPRSRIKRSGSSPALEGDDPDLKILFGEQGNRLFRGVCARSVRVEVDEKLLGVAAEQPDLHLGKGRSAGRQHIVKSGHVGRDAVHLPFHQQGKLPFPDRLPRLIEIEQHLALGVEGGLGRVHVLRPGFLVAIECSRGKGNHPA